MKKVFRFFTVIFTIQIFLSNCVSESNSTNSQKEIKHIHDYYFTDQTSKNMFHRAQDFDDLRECPILVDMSRWFFDTRWSRNSWIRDQSWMFPDGMISETDTGINDKDDILPKELTLIYVGPWKEISLKKGLIWGEVINKKIRFVATQKQNDVNKGYIYASYQFMNPNNKDIPEKPITLSDDLPTPEFVTFCEVKWIAKYGYNAIYDQKTKKIIQAK